MNINKLPLPEEGLKVHLDVPTENEGCLSDTVLFAGNVVCGEGCLPNQIELVWEEFSLLKTALFPVSADETGIRCVPFRLGIPMIGTGNTPMLTVRVHLGDGKRVDVLTVQLERSSREISVPLRLNPCLVTGLGRSGTTRLMQILSESLEIHCRDQYPYETRMAQYFMQKYWVDASPALHLPDYNIDNFYNKNFTQQSGPCPYVQTSYDVHASSEEWYMKEYLPSAERLYLQSIENYYLSQGERGSLEERNRNGDYFLEKFHPTQMPFLFHELYPDTKEIFLVRDFRDMFASMLEFTQKRRVEGFGQISGDSAERFAERVSNSVDQLVRSWRLRSGKALLVRYEDLVRAEAETRVSICQYLQISETPMNPTDAQSTFSEHMTSENAEKSIGKWKILSEPLLDYCEFVFSEGLYEFGYF
jgi:hypothetical protein